MIQYANRIMRIILYIYANRVMRIIQYASRTTPSESNLLCLVSERMQCLHDLIVVCLDGGQTLLQLLLGFGWILEQLVSVVQNGLAFGPEMKMFFFVNREVFFLNCWN